MSARDRFDQRGVGPRRLVGVIRDYELHLDAPPAELHWDSDPYRILVITHMALVQRGAPQRDRERGSVDDDALDETAERLGTLGGRTVVECGGDLLGAVEKLTNVIGRRTR